MRFEVAINKQYTKTFVDDNDKKHLHFENILDFFAHAYEEFEDLIPELEPGSSIDSLSLSSI